MKASNAQAALNLTINNNRGDDLPSLALSLLKLVNPALSPGVSKINDEHQLDKDEEEATNHTKIHPHLAKMTPGNEECTNDCTNQDQVFQTPEPVQIGKEI